MANSPPYARRVHIVPLGFEYARLTDPLVEWGAEKVVAVEYADSEAEVPFLEELLAELEADDSMTVERRSCDIFDLYEALGVIAAAIDDHPDDEVYVNLSAGSKITAIAGMIACMASGAHPIYARPDYGPESSRVPAEPIHDAVAEIFELPTYPIERPSTVHVAHLAFIEANTDEDGVGGRYRGVSKKELIAFGRERGFEYIADSEASSRHGLYRLLDRHVIRPLRDRGAIDIERVGRRSMVTLTPAGRNTLRAFRYVVDAAAEGADPAGPA